MCAGLGAIDLVVIAQPSACRVVITNHVAGDAVGTLHGELLLGCHLGQTAHEVNTKLQPFAMNIVSQGLETYAVGG